MPLGPNFFSPLLRFFSKKLMLDMWAVVSLQQITTISYFIVIKNGNSQRKKKRKFTNHMKRKNYCVPGVSKTTSGETWLMRKLTLLLSSYTFRRKHNHGIIIRRPWMMKRVLKARRSTRIRKLIHLDIFTFQPFAQENCEPLLQRFIAFLKHYRFRHQYWPCFSVKHCVVDVQDSWQWSTSSWTSQVFFFFHV